MPTDNDTTAQQLLFGLPDVIVAPEAEEQERELRTFANDEVANILDLLPRVHTFGSYEELKAHLQQELPYNSESTRQRRTSDILNRLFPHGTLQTPLAYYAARCATPDDLKPALFYELLLAEPLAARVAEEAVWPSLAKGYVEREAIRECILQHLSEPSPASQRKVLRAIFNTYALLGAAQESDHSLRVRVHDETLEAFIYVFLGEFAEPGVYTFSELEQSRLRRWLLWDREWMRKQLYNLRDLGLVAKVSEIDTVRQFTTALDRITALRRYFEDERPVHRAVREKDDG